MKSEAGGLSELLVRLCDNIRIHLIIYLSEAHKRSPTIIDNETIPILRLIIGVSVLLGF